MSANSAVTVFRSPSIVVEESDCNDVTRISAGDTFAEGDSVGSACARLANGFPHSPQNFSPSSFAAPHD
jgi:hypothetical protein